MKILRVLGVLLLLFLAFTAAYFIKCQLGLCLVRDSFLDKIPPFNLLQNRNPYHIIYAPKENVDLLPNDFPFLQGAEIWNPLWSQEEGKVSINYDDSNDHQTGIFITSQSAKGWEIGHKKLIQVSQGDLYHFSAWVKTSGDGIAGSLSVITYDSSFKQLQWGYAMESVAGKENWQYVKADFKVPHDAKYLRFQLSGYGVGQTGFNDLKFFKE